LFKDKFIPFIPLLSNGGFKFGSRHSTVVPISNENPLFAIFEADNAFDIKRELVHNLLFIKHDKFMNLNYFVFDGYRKIVKYSSSFDDTFIKRFICSGNSDSGNYISYSDPKTSYDDFKSIVVRDKNIDASSKRTSNFYRKIERIDLSTPFSSTKRSYSSVSSARYNELVRKRSSDLKYKFNQCEIQDIHKYYLSNNNKAIPISKLNPKSNPTDKLESKTVMDDIVISL
jgi:hypothetical protein